jgi:ribosome recycling factor
MSLSQAYEVFSKCREEALNWFTKEIAGLRTGRVSPNSIQNIIVEHYGARTPLNGVASIASSDARTLVITPWDQTAIAAIEKAITVANLGVQPVIDGRVIRLSFPSLTEEIRNQTIKMLHNRAEEARVQLRQGRDEALKMLKQEKQDGKLPEDDFYKGKEKLDDLIAAASKEIDTIIEKKEADIKTI